MKLDPETLKYFYYEKNLSLAKIGKLFGITEPAIFYWMKKHNIPRRKFATQITKKLLERLYVKEQLSSLKIGKKLHYNSRYIRKLLVRYRIPRRTLSEAGRKYTKQPFSGDLNLKAYMLGLRAGDFYAKPAHLQIRVQTTTTHPAQVKMMAAVFEKFSHVGQHEFYNKNFEVNQWFIYCDLDKSFEFLLEKPHSIPNWILEDNGLFFNFLAGYVDSEGSWRMFKSHEKWIRYSFQIKSQDKEILQQIFSKLNEIGYKTNIYLDKKAGVDERGKKSNADTYGIIVYQAKDVFKLASEMLLFSKHQEKIDKMNLLLGSRGKTWEQVEKDLIKFRNKIKQTRLK